MIKTFAIIIAVICVVVPSAYFTAKFLERIASNSCQLTRPEVSLVPEGDIDFIK